MSKLLEKISHDQLLSNIFNTFDLLSISQPGFCPEYSIEDVLIHLTESWGRLLMTVYMLGSASGSCKNI